MSHLAMNPFRATSSKSASPHDDSYPQVSRPGVTDIATSPKSPIDDFATTDVTDKTDVTDDSPNAPQGQHLIAQGSTLGDKSQDKSAPCKGKTIIKRCCPYRALSGSCSHSQSAALGYVIAGLAGRCCTLLPTDHCE